jgi:hypothetical protein
MILRRDHFVAVADQQRDDLAETGSVGPQAMCEDDAGFAGHQHLQGQLLLCIPNLALTPPL